MRPRGVVVRDVDGKHLAQVSLTEDQHPVGGLWIKRCFRPDTPG